MLLDSRKVQSFFKRILSQSTNEKKQKRKKTFLYRLKEKKLTFVFYKPFLEHTAFTTRSTLVYFVPVQHIYTLSLDNFDLPKAIKRGFLTFLF